MSDCKCIHRGLGIRILYAHVYHNERGEPEGEILQDINLIAEPGDIFLSFLTG